MTGYLWRGNPALAEINSRLVAERDGRPQRAAEPAFSWPMPLPGPPAKAGKGSAEAKARRRQEARERAEEATAGA